MTGDLKIPLIYEPLKSLFMRTALVWEGVVFYLFQVGPEKFRLVALGTLAAVAVSHTARSRLAGIPGICQA